MKVRKGFVTNSSSSSFIIAKKDVDPDFLINTVLKELYYGLQGDEPYNPAELLENDEAVPFGIFSARIDQGRAYPVEDPNGDYYFIYNNDFERFDWEIVRGILNKYGLKWEFGYCD